MDSSTFKRFSASVDNILESLEDIDFNAMGMHYSLSTLHIYLFSIFFRGLNDISTKNGKDNIVIV